MAKIRKSSFNDSHPVLQTRVPEEFYHRIKAEAAARKVSLAKLLTTLFDEHTQSVPDLATLKDQWKEDGWVECAAWILENFESKRFCDIDWIRLTRLLKSDENRWPKIQQAMSAARDKAPNQSSSNEADPLLT